jgi:hypothetical protein
MLKLLARIFCYHIWSKSWPKRDRRGNSDLDSVTDERSRTAIVNTAGAIEAFVNFGCIVTDILQSLALNCDQIIWKDYRSWLRTFTPEVPSEET